MRTTDQECKRDLVRYVDSASMSLPEMVETWINSQRYKELLPEETSVPDSAAFTRRLAILLITLATEEGRGGKRPMDKKRQARWRGLLHSGGSLGGKGKPGSGSV